jgi:hypothetical protein
VMDPVVLGVLAAVLITIIQVTTRVRERGEDLHCPRCKLSFRKDVVYFVGLSLTTCPFCGRVITVSEVKKSKSIADEKVLDDGSLLKRLFRRDGSSDAEN